MNQDIGLNNDLEVKDKKLHIQTSYSNDLNLTSVSVFEGGTMLCKRDFVMEDISEHQLQHEVQQCHELVKTDIELLFHMADKVHESQHLPSITNLGQLFLERGFYEEAIDLFEKAKTIDTHTMSSDYELAKAYFKKGDYSSALQELETVVSHYPDYPDVHLLLGKTHWRLKNFSTARQHFHHAVQINEKYWDAFHSLALALVESTLDLPVDAELPPPIERLKEAEQLFRKALRLAPDLDETLMEEGLEKLKDTSEVEEALALFERARKPESQGKLFDSEFYLKFMFGQLDDNSQELDYYIQSIESVLKENPQYADLRHSLGIAYLLKGWQCFSKATGEFEKAVDINPAYEKAKRKLKLMQNDGRGLLILLRAILN